MDIFIGNIPDYFTEADLERIFHDYGSMATYKIVEYVDDKGDERRYGLSTLLPDIEAVHAIKYLKDYKVDGLPIEIRPFYVRARKHDQRHGDTDIFARIFHNRRKDDRRSYAHGFM